MNTLSSNKPSSILVLTDFSKCAQNAASYAIYLSERLQANLIIFNSYYVPVGYGDGPGKKHDAMMEIGLQKLEAEALRLREVISKRTAAYKPEVTIKNGDGAVADNVAIIMSDRPDVEMIIMGGYKLKNNDDFFFGTAIRDVLGQAGCPVIVIPESQQLPE